MKVRFQADANLDLISASDSSGVIPRSTIAWPWDLRMPKHFADFTAVRDSPGLLLVPPRMSIGETIEGLFLCWLSWTAEEMRNQIRWLPR